MKQALKIGTIEKVGFSLKNEEEKTAEKQAVETKEIKSISAKSSLNDRFARLKKSLRKRSVSIL